MCQRGFLWTIRLQVVLLQRQIVLQSQNLPFSHVNACYHILSLELGYCIVSILAIVNNVLGILIWCKQLKQINQVQFLLLTDLSISDILMGVHLISLLSVDLYYTDFPPSHLEAW